MTTCLLYSCCTFHSPEGVIQLRTGWAQDVWLQWLYESWYFLLDISRWQRITLLWTFGGRLDILKNKIGREGLKHISPLIAYRLPSMSKSFFTGEKQEGAFYSQVCQAKNLLFPKLFLLTEIVQTRSGITCDICWHSVQIQLKYWFKMCNHMRMSGERQLCWFQFSVVAAVALLMATTPPVDGNPAPIRLFRGRRTYQWVNPFSNWTSQIGCDAQGISC